jgi:hypothetical protein
MTSPISASEEKLEVKVVWENFEKVIDKAKFACINAGEDVSNNFS